MNYSLLRDSFLEDELHTRETGRSVTIISAVLVVFPPFVADAKDRSHQGYCGSADLSTTLVELQFQQDYAASILCEG